jgi:hypothetical protein
MESMILSLAKIPQLRTLSIRVYKTSGPQSMYTNLGTLLQHSSSLRKLGVVVSTLKDMSVRIVSTSTSILLRDT